VISLHAPLTSETRHAIGADEFARMRPTTILVNTARGGLVDELALAEALRAGRIAGAAVDCFEHEPPGRSPLLSLPTFIATPHVGATTREANERMGVSAARNVLAVLFGEGEADVVAGPGKALASTGRREGTPP
jgi:D-3-phosphoglycerate dehydrogenase / 2-oxoglutarate reductase